MTNAAAETAGPAGAASDSSPSVKLLASHAISQRHNQPNSPAPSLSPADADKHSPSVFFSSVQWSADGTAALVGRSDHSVVSFVLPPDLLDPTNEARHLQPDGIVRLPEPIQAIAGSPYFSLVEPASQTFLAGCRDHPIQLYHAFPQQESSPPLCSYKLIKHETEEYISPSSILWPQPGSHFICGSADRLDYFDISRYGSDGPVMTIPTIPSKRHVLKGGGVGMKGTVSALAASAQLENGGIIAAGTRTRWMGLYDLRRADKSVAHWTVAGADQEEFGREFGGQGIMQTVWSTCGRYLVINERQSSGLLVYDIRVAGKLLTVLGGRQAQTQQRLSCDIYSSPQGEPGFEVWCGNQAGAVQVWDEVGLHYGVKESAWSWDAHDAPVSSSIVHPSGSVALTCSGAWDYPKDDDIPGTQDTPSGTRTRILDESSIKVWSIGSPEVHHPEAHHPEVYRHEVGSPEAGSPEADSAQAAPA